MESFKCQFLQHNSFQMEITSNTNNQLEQQLGDLAKLYQCQLNQPQRQYSY